MDKLFVTFCKGVVLSGSICFVLFISWYESLSEIGRIKSLLFMLCFMFFWGAIFVATKDIFSKASEEMEESSEKLEDQSDK